MITLDYYDDNTVRDNAVFFTAKKIFAIVIASFWAFVFSIYKLYKLYKIKIEANTQTAQIVFSIILAMSFTIMLIFIMYYLSCDYIELYSRNDLMKLKNNYESERKKVLEEHKYNYSIFTDYCNNIDKEILCDSFSVDNEGYAYIMNSDFDTVLDESENNKEKYHHIVDNRDGHTITVKELKEKYLSKNINGKSPENNKSESKSHSNDSKNEIGSSEYNPIIVTFSNGIKKISLAGPYPETNFAILDGCTRYVGADRIDSIGANLDVNFTVTREKHEISGHCEQFVMIINNQLLQKLLNENGMLVSHS